MVTQRQFQEALNQLDPMLLERYFALKDRYTKKKASNHKAKSLVIRLGSLVACLLLIWGGIWMAAMLQPKKSEGPHHGLTATDATKATTYDPQSDPEASSSTGYPSDEVQRPQLMYNGKIYLYQATGFDQPLPEDFVLVGSIESVNNTEPPAENFTGCRLDIGQNIFANEVDPDTVYVQYKSGYARFTTE